MPIDVPIDLIHLLLQSIVVHVSLDPAIPDLQFPIPPLSLLQPGIQLDNTLLFLHQLHFQPLIRAAAVLTPELGLMQPLLEVLDMFLQIEYNVAGLC